METVIQIRPSKLLLSWQHDPQKQYPFFDKSNLEEASGLIPDFFERALSLTESGNLETIADGMDELYQYGGFAQYPLGGELKANGTYVSPYADDEDLHPYVALASLDPSRCDVECFVYPYGIVGLRDSNGQCKIARFD
jgi:hypothetical protein